MTLNLFEVAHDRTPCLHTWPWIVSGSDHQACSDERDGCALTTLHLCARPRSLAIRLIVAMGAHTPPAQRSRRSRVAIDAVMSNPDLVSIILRSPIGPSTFVAASRVSKVWHAVCRSDEHALRGVALYQGGLTRTALRGLFGLTSAEAAAYPHTTHAHAVGRYCVYEQMAIDLVLADHGINARHTREAAIAAVPRLRLYPVGLEDRMRTSRLEDFFPPWSFLTLFPP